jgi:hypothetical protein
LYGTILIGFLFELKRRSHRQEEGFIGASGRCGSVLANFDYEDEKGIKIKKEDREKQINV